MSQSIGLHMLPIGTTGKVLSLHNAPDVSRRLLELGVIKGTPIVVTGRAPLGDPLMIRVRGCQIAIRGMDAKNIQVEYS